jgi:hypothetical protein
MIPALQKLLADLRAANPQASFQSIWNEVCRSNPELIPPETHPAFQPSDQATHQFSVECIGWENPDGTLKIQGGILSPL